MAAGRVRARVADRIAVIVMDRPPANVLNAAMRDALSKAIAHFSQDEGVDAIVIAGEGSAFSAGYDARDIGLADAPMADLCEQIETCRVPVVVALAGAALAGGAEVACAAAARVASEAMMMGFPQVNLGVPPSVGTIQRLTRLVGPAVAIEMLDTGRPIDIRVASKHGLADHLVGPDVLPAAVSFAKDMVRGRAKVDVPAVRPRHLRNGPKFVEAIKDARKTAPPDSVRSLIIDAVEAVLLLPPAAVSEFHATVTADWAGHAQSVSSRHVFEAERHVSVKLLEGRSDTPRRVTAKGQSVVARLFVAQDRAIIALVQGGATESEIDAALLRYGAAIGPFGRTKVPAADVQPTVLHKIVTAVMAEGARCVEQRVVDRASDIDALAVHGMRWPRRSGGPMHWCTVQGLGAMVAQMESWAQEDSVWAVPDLLRSAALLKAGFAGQS